MGIQIESGNQDGIGSPLRLLLEQWYTWLCSKPESLFQHSNESSVYDSVASYFDKLISSYQDAIRTNEQFCQDGAQHVIQQLEAVETLKEGAAMKQNQNKAKKKAQLMQYIEQWYTWLGSNDSALFHKQDQTQMQQTVLYFHEAIGWLSRTTMVNTEWFFDEGSDIVMNRWLKEDYDAYE